MRGRTEEGWGKITCFQKNASVCPPSFQSTIPHGAYNPLRGVVKSCGNGEGCGKTHCAPGNDMMSPEMIKSNVDWWAPVLTAVFIHVNLSSRIPSGWSLAIIVPIYKKEKSNPSNYQPISLLRIISKLHSRYSYWKLLDQLDEKMYWWTSKQVSELVVPP